MTPLRSQVGLNALNFCVGAIQTAFGPFFTVYLTQKGWNQVDIGFSLSVGTAAALILQLPAGALIDAVHLKRVAIAFALLMIGLSALAVVTAPTEASVLVSRVLQAFAGCLLTPAIAALTLKLSGHDAFGERLGTNGRYASLGNAVAAAVLGGIAYYVSEGAVFIFTCSVDCPGAGDAPGVSPRRPCRGRPSGHASSSCEKEEPAPPAAYLPRSDPACFRGLHTPVPIRQRRDVAAGPQYAVEAY